MAGVPEVASRPVVEEWKSFGDERRQSGPVFGASEGGVRVYCLFAFFVRRWGVSRVSEPSLVQVRLWEKGAPPPFSALAPLRSLELFLLSSSPANAGRGISVVPRRLGSLSDYVFRSRLRGRLNV